MSATPMAFGRPRTRSKRSNSSLKSRSRTRRRGRAGTRGAEALDPVLVLRNDDQASHVDPALDRSGPLQAAAGAVSSSGEIVTLALTTSEPCRRRYARSVRLRWVPLRQVRGPHEEFHGAADDGGASAVECGVDPPTHRR